MFVGPTQDAVVKASQTFQIYQKMNLIFTPAYFPFFAWSDHSSYYQILYVPFTTTKFLFPSLTDYKVGID